MARDDDPIPGKFTELRRLRVTLARLKIRVQQRRAANGRKPFTQRDLAQRMNVDESHVSHLLACRKVTGATYQVALTMARHFGGFRFPEREAEVVVIKQLLDQGIAKGQRDALDDPTTAVEQRSRKVTEESASRSEKRPPRHRVGVVPPVAHQRVARGIDAVLDRWAARGGTVVVSQVVSGMGGVGKTQAAAKLTERLWANKDVDVMVWVTAASRDQIISTYAQAAADVGQPRKDPEAAATRFMAWLAETDRRWLVILDNLDTPADANGLWPPHTDTGRCVVTTRYRGTVLEGAGREVVGLGVFTDTEATTYLDARLDQPETSHDELTGLAADLGHLPLALAHATGYIRDQDITVAAYSELLADQRQRLADVMPQADESPDAYPATVAATWALSIQAANDKAPAGLAGTVLELASLLDPNGIPVTVLAHNKAREHYATRLDTAPSEHDESVHRSVSKEQLVTALRILHRYSLITHDRTDETVRVHAVVQRAVRDTLTESTLAETARAAADSLTAAWPDIEDVSKFTQTLRANATSLYHHSHTTLLTPHIHPVLINLGTSLGAAGQFWTSADHFQLLLLHAHHHHGPDHPDTLATRHHLARFRGEAGNVDAAVIELERLLPDRIRVLGTDHPDTLATRHRLATWRGIAGDAVAAVAEYELLLPDQVRVMGSNHPQTLTTRHELAYFRGTAGDAVAAVAELERLLPDRVELLGPDHLQSLDVRHDLARFRGEAGDAVAAVAELERLLPDQVRELGPDHPHTLSTRHELARWRGNAGDAVAAVAEYELLLPDRIELLGPNHPDTLTTRHNLAYFRGAAGNTAAALEELERLLSDRTLFLGPNHPNTLRTRHHLARFRGEAGDKVRAAAELESLLTDQERVLSLDHPHTRDTRHALAHFRNSSDSE